MVCRMYPGLFFSSGDWLKRLMKRKEEETAREKRRVRRSRLKRCQSLVLFTRMN